MGRTIGISLGRTKWCLCSALDHWLAAARIDQGAVFRRVDRHRRISVERLSAEAVGLVVRERVAAAGFEATGFSGHSLRAGFASSAVEAGISALKVRAQTGHASDMMLASCVRDGELLVDNAAGSLL